MIYVIYLILAAIVVLLSNKAASYVDMLEKRTRLSGAFLGGVMLSAVTSLPELFTSLSSTILLHKPGMCIGNILGSDIFNLAVLALLMLFYYRSFGSARVSSSHTRVALFVCLIYIALGLNMLHILDFEFITISMTSVIIMMLYIFGVKQMSSDNTDTLTQVKKDEASKDANEQHHPITLNQLVLRFVLVSIGIVAVSIAITYATDAIAVKLDLGQGIAGAILLGVATSLPEVSSTIALFRMKNFNIAIGNIIGSNIFNFLILTLADVFYVGSGLYVFNDPKTMNLLVFGFIGTLAMLAMLRFKNKCTQIVCPLCAFGCYVAFLVV